MNVRLPAVAGSFYPADPAELAATVDALLGAAARAEPAVVPKAFVVPHAAYMYSGPIAASAYSVLATQRDRITRVVLLGPAHRARLVGMALPSVDAFRTPLGDVPIDTGARHALTGTPGIVIDDAPHKDEHSLEVQLPFLQRALGSFTLVPLAVGWCATEVAASVIQALWGGPETVVLVSSDLSHYESYASAAHHDRVTAEAIVCGRPDRIKPHDACGAYPLRGLLELAGTRELTTTLLDLRSSGDTGGPRDRVVGYGSFALSPAS